MHMDLRVKNYTNSQNLLAHTQQDGHTSFMCDDTRKIKRFLYIQA